VVLTIWPWQQDRLGGARRPAAREEAQLWELVKAAWAPLGAEVSQARHALAARPPGRNPRGLSTLLAAREAFLVASVNFMPAMERPRPPSPGVPNILGHA
jgi:hypothetical protein